MKWIFSCTVIFLLMTSPASADIFRYVDNQGVICYTDTPKGNKADRIYKDAQGKSPVQNTSRRSDSGSGTREADYHQIIHEKASTYDLDPSLVKAVITTESNWNRTAVSQKGAIGLMQLMPATALEMNVKNPFDAEENIEGGTRYLKYLLERFNGDLTLALAAYNAGPGTVEKFGYVPPITETKHYVKKVLSLYQGRTDYPALAKAPVKAKQYAPIYKVLQDDGSLLFTNSSLFSKNTARF